MSNEEMKCIEMLKSLFGGNILEKHAIIIITKGDNFKKDNTSFHDWLRENQNKYFRQLLTACKNRCVLFDNKTNDEKCMKEQLVILINYIDSLGEVPYTNQMFEDAAKLRAEYFSDSILLNNIFTSSCVSLYEDLKRLTKAITISPSIEDQVNDIFTILGNPNKDTQIYNLFTAIQNVNNQIKIKRTTAEIMMKHDKTVVELMSCLFKTVDEINTVDEKVTPQVRSRHFRLPFCSIL